MTLFSPTRSARSEGEDCRGSEGDAAKREALRQSLLPKFKDLGLPESGPCPEYTAAEKERGFRVFFPPVSASFRELAAAGGELTESVHLFGCPGQTLTLVVAIRALKDVET